MQIEVFTNEDKATDYAENLYKQSSALHDGDMMLLSQGRVILEAVVCEVADEIKALIYEFQSEDICNLSELDGFDYFESQDFVKLTVFDNVKEAKEFMLARATESMMLNSMI
ncbi:hypothetical protein ACN1NW_000423 [Acinetobacter baumannii]|nr:hypothetical protein [Acinetobacter baumannii]ELA7031011.1 hypothetical protein [Acinetobacter baumannii]ELA7118774.1 hypothetical protein [Acinetobacter baumannii]ELB0919723.1 hypothetical protein [Acinetobacter baumannii]ELB0965900.1 hypothetical protein [Acinetobacter baumannii]